MTTARRSPSKEFWTDRRVLLTGHTGFKGAWASLMLRELGAKVSGFALPPETQSLFILADVARDVDSVLGDLRDEAHIALMVARCKPQIILHLAAQPLVRRSFEAPVETCATNVMGTVHLLEALRHTPEVEAILVVTTDKVYANDEDGRVYAEDDRLGGHDPYAASKAAAELVVAAYAASFFDAADVPLATARAGNVIGGGDFSVDRIVPDVWRALAAGTPVALRNPDATRPWQHVLDCLCGYLLYIEDLVAKPAATTRALNFGPDPADKITVAALVEAMQGALGTAAGWRHDAGRQPHEMQRLAIDARRARETLAWSDRWPGRAAIDVTANWYKKLANGADMRAATIATIQDHELG